MKAAISLVLALCLSLGGCVSYFPVTGLGRDTQDPNEILGVSVGMPVLPLQVRASLEKDI